MNVGDDRHICPFADLDHSCGRVVIGHGNTDDLAAGRDHLVDLADRGVNIGRVGFGHRLDDDRRTAANLNIADHDRSCNYCHIN